MVAVVAGDDEQFGGGVGPNAVGGGQPRDELGGQLVEQFLVAGDLLVQLLPAARDPTQGMSGGGFHRGDLARAQPGAAVNQRHLRQRLQLRTQLGRGVDEDGLERDHRRRTRFDGNVFRDFSVRSISTIPSAVFGVACA